MDPLELAGGGRLLLAGCPGKRQLGASAGAARRYLAGDLAAIRQAGAALLITLMEQHELEMFGIADIGSAAAAADLAWRHLPICDMSAPDAAFEQEWLNTGEEIHRRLDSGGTVLLHCLGGYGRTGTIAARLLVERGLRPARAITEVRAARPRSIQTKYQERYVYNFPHSLAGRPAEDSR